MVLTESSLSTDILRYMWDGMLLGNKVDPYKYVPSSPTLDTFKTVSWYEAYDHKDEYTIYPPFAQLFFGSNYILFKNNPIGLKSVFSAFDMLNGIIIALIIRKNDGRIYQGFLGSIIYLWNPLVIIEFSNSGHLDTLALFLLLLSLYFLLDSSIIKTSSLLAMSILTKWISILVFPLYAKTIFKKKPLVIKMFCTTVISAAIFILPFYLSSGLSFITGMMNFIENWRFESALSRLFTFILNGDVTDDIFVAKVVSYLIFIISYSIILYKVSITQVDDIIDISILVLALFLFVTPAVYPWYVPWILAFTAISKPDLRTWFSISLSGIAVVNYLQQFYPLSITQFWTAYVVWYIPVVAIILFYLYKIIISKKPHQESVLS